MVMNQKDRTKQSYYKERSTPNFYPESAFIGKNPAMKLKEGPGGQIEFIQNVYVPERIQDQEWKHNVKYPEKFLPDDYSCRSKRKQDQHACKKENGYHVCSYQAVAGTQGTFSIIRFMTS